MRFTLVLCAILGLDAAAAAAAEPATIAAASILRRAFATACREAANRANAISRRLYWTHIKDHEAPATHRVRGVKRLLFRSNVGDELRMTVFAPGGHVRRITAEVHSMSPRGEARPALMAVAGGDCRIIHGRRIEYGDDGRPASVAFLDSDLQPSGRNEPLDASVPAGGDPGGVAVAVVDSGVNYTLPVIARRLARDGAGRTLGHDFWDMDARPFDLDTSRSPFFPIRHGTRVASILLREAPAARLIPYRYPRPDLGRLADLVADAEAKGSIIIALPMGSNKRADWAVFEAAARARAHLLFIVSAGNNGRDIDTAPVYPAALPLDNLLVVTSAD
ncbi:MAG: S8 family serine peptidase, partial [Rhodospirillales bacterium]|nr:S8 family serine peptidase [Rhodospirillales bacterium]